MDDLKGIGLQGFFDQIPTEQLDEMLCEELKKDPVDENAVRLIMGVLKERDANCDTEITPGIEREWEKYKDDSGTSGGKHKHRKMRGLVLKVVAIVTIVCLMLSMVPINAEAESLFEKFIRWTESVFEFFGSKDNDDRLVSYEFQTDNPGLQQVYDAVEELGITDPIVPMWIPETFRLEEIKLNSTPRRNRVHVMFSDGISQLIFEVNVCNSDEAHVYYKDDTEADRFELHGTIYYIVSNNDRWSVVWTKSNVECCLAVECQEEILYEIIRSIYMKEDG